MYDAIVIGARCAGSPTAMLLARKGYRVLLLDKATFPSDMVSTHYIHQPGIAALHRWGLLDRLAATGCPPIRTITIDAGGVTLAGCPTPIDGIDAAYAPRRIVLDKLLAAAAVEAGAELREGFGVQELLMDSEPGMPGALRVRGIRGRARDGATVTETARIVIGADGRHSLVARMVAAPIYNPVPALTCSYYTYWSGVPIDGMESYPRAGRLVGAFPTHDGLTCVFVTWPNREFHRFRADIEGNYLASLELAPALAERVRGGRREARWAGTADLPGYFRRPFGLGWALVGDAGYVKDPVTATGISDGFRDAELLAAAIDAGLAGRAPLEEALAGYEQARNEASLPKYAETCACAALPPAAPEALRFFAALREDADATRRFFGVAAGTVRHADFYTPETMQRFLGPPDQRAA